MFQYFGFFNLVVEYMIGNFQGSSLLDPGPWPEGSYELGSVCPSVLLSRSFLWIGSLVFSETQHGVRGPCLVVHDRAGFFLKNLFAPKMGKTGQKWAKSRVF